MSSISFDLDGTIYSSLTTIIFPITNRLLIDYGHSTVTLTEYKSVYQMKDVVKFAKDLGFYESEVAQVVADFHKMMDEAGSPVLIPGTYHLLKSCVDYFGRDNMFVITNEKDHRVRERFEVDGLDAYFCEAISCDDKSSVIEEFAKKQSGLIYVGDTVSDGLDCAVARTNGAQVDFWALTHAYSMNLERAVNDFAVENSSFVRAFESLYAIRGEIRKLQKELQIN